MHMRAHTHTDTGTHTRTHRAVNTEPYLRRLALAEALIYLADPSLFSCLHDKAEN